MTTRSCASSCKLTAGGCGRTGRCVSEAYNHAMPRRGGLLPKGRLFAEAGGETSCCGGELLGGQSAHCAPHMHSVALKGLRTLPNTSMIMRSRPQTIGAVQVTPSRVRASWSEVLFIL